MSKYCIPGYFSKSMMSPDLRDAMICTDTYWKRISLLIRKMLHLSSMIKNKSFKLLNLISFQTLICNQVQVFIHFPIILRRILFLNNIFNDPFLYLTSMFPFMSDLSFHYSSCFLPTWWPNG